VTRPRCPAGSPLPPGGSASGCCARRRDRARPCTRWTSRACPTSGPAGLTRAERHAALREAFDQLPPNGKQLISLLIADPPLPYADISARLGIPVGSIGPNRSRYLDKMRRHPAVAALINA
jgi:DNA-directed RNA polymerase specialized sigma24 family protein